MSRVDLTKGPILNDIVSFSLPYLLAYFLQLLYGLADLYVIGLYDGVENTTAVAVGSQIMHFFTVVLVSLAMGSTVVIARASGAGDERAISGVIGNTVSIFSVFACLLTFLSLLLVRPIVGWMSTPSEAVEGTVSYLVICFAGIPFITVYNVIAAVFRGLGDSRSPMWFVAVACLFNIVLDFVFIGGLGMGPAGAAYATVFSQAFSVAVSMLWMRLGGILDVNLRKEDFLFQKRLGGKILATGAPVAVQDGFIQLAFLVITIIANLRGLDDSAAVGIVEKIISMLFLVPSAMLSTVSTMSAQNIGAGRWDRACATLKTAMSIALLYGGAVAVLMQFTAVPVVGLFTDSEEVTRLGAEYLRSYSLDTAMAGCHFCFSGFFIACGYSIVSFIHNFLSVLMVRIPLSYLLSSAYPDTLLPMGFAAPAGSMLSVFICIGFYVWFTNSGRKDSMT